MKTELQTVHVKRNSKTPPHPHNLTASGVPSSSPKHLDGSHQPGSVWMPLLVLVNMLTFASTQTILGVTSPSSTNSMQGAYTVAMDWIPEAAFNAIISTESNNIFTLPQSSESVGNTRLFSKSGAKLAEVSAGVGNVFSNLYVGNFIALIFGKTTNIQAFTLSKKGTTYAFTKNSKFTLTIKHNYDINMAVQNPTTSTLYLLGFGNTMRAYDFVTKTMIATQTFPDLNSPQHLVLFGGNYIVILGICQYMFIVDRAYLTTTSFLFPASNGGKIGLEDNIDKSWFYLGQHEAWTLVKMKLSGMDTTYSHALFLSLPSGKTDNILNFGNYQFLGVHIEGTKSILLVRKISMTIASNNIMADNIRFRSFCMNYQLDLSFYFSWLTDSGSFNNLLISRALFTYPCTSRDALFVCTICDTGYYRDSLRPYNQCVRKEDFLPAHGVDEARKLMAPCETGCLTCTDVHTWCTLADTARGYSLNATNGTVYLTSGNTTNSSNHTTTPVEICLVANCAKCDSGNPSVCETCMFGYYFQEDHNSNCYENHLEGFGRVSNDDSVLKACEDPNCLECYENHLTCDMCESTYYLDPRTNSTCFNLSQIPNGYGLTESGDSVEKCTDQKCQVCKNLNTNCTSCENKFYLKAFVDLPDMFGCYLQETDLDTEVTLNVLQNSEMKAENITLLDDRSFRILVFCNLTRVSKGMYAAFLEEHPPKVVLYQKNGEIDQQTLFSMEQTPTSMGIIIVGRFTEMFPPDDVYHPLVKIVQRSVMPLDGFNVTLKGGNFNFSFPNKYNQAAVATFEDLGGIFGFLTGSTLTSPVYASSLVLLGMISPLNIVLIVTQSLRMFSRMFLINMEFGPKLGRFLSVICQPTAYFPGTHHQSYDVRHARVHLGRMTEKRFTTDFAGGFVILAAIYVCLWAWRVLKIVVLSQNYKPSMSFAIFSYMAAKFHVIFLIFFFSDLLLYSGLSTNFLKGFNTSRVLGGLVFNLLVIECLYIYMQLTNKRNWKEILRLNNELHYMSEKTDSKCAVVGPSEGRHENLVTESPLLSSRDSTAPSAGSQTNILREGSKSLWVGRARKLNRIPFKRMGNSLLGRASDESLSSVPSGGHIRETKFVLDHNKVRRHLHIDHAICSQSYSCMKLSSISYMTDCAVLIFFSRMLRIGLLQILILGSQRTPLLALASFAAVEIAYLVQILTEHKQTKFVKSRCELLLSTSQALMMSIFLMMASFVYVRDLLSETTASKLQESEIFQVAGVVIIISAVGIEYFLLIVEHVVPFICKGTKLKLCGGSNKRISWFPALFDWNPLFFKNSDANGVQGGRGIQSVPTEFVRKLKFKAKSVTKPDGTVESTVTSTVYPAGGRISGNFQINLQVSQIYKDGLSRGVRNDRAADDIRKINPFKQSPEIQSMIQSNSPVSKLLKGVSGSPRRLPLNSLTPKPFNLKIHSPLASEYSSPSHSSKKITMSSCFPPNTHDNTDNGLGDQSPLKLARQKYSKLIGMGPRRLKTQVST